MKNFFSQKQARLRVVLTGALALVCAVASLAPLATRADLVWSSDGSWHIEGGVLAPFFGDAGETASALEAMNKAKTAQEAGSYWTALSLYDRVINDYPSSVFAPEALFQKGLIYLKRHQFDKAFKSFDDITQRYPDYPRFNAVIGKQYQVASTIQSGATPYVLWGYLPWFSDPNKAVDYYESVVKNAPNYELAPAALWNISQIAKKGHGMSNAKPEIAIDALDRLINTYPQSMLAPDAYLELASIYSNLVQGAPYDQGSTRDAIRFYHDYLFLFKGDPGAALAQKKLDDMMDVYARSRLILGDFFYYYRNSNRAALIFYNQAITLAPTSPAATEAKAQIDKIRRGIAPPLTPYDWVFGRYKEPSLVAYEEQGQVDNLAAESFQVKATDTFIETPGAEAVETVSATGQVKQYEGLSPYPADIDVPGAPVDAGFLTPVDQPQGGSGPGPGQEPGGRPLIR